MSVGGTEQVRGRGRPRNFDENRVLTAALEVFRIQGFSATSLDDLTAATGLNRPSLYGAFGNKQALFLAAVKFYWATTGQLFQEALFTGSTLENDLNSLFEVQIEIISRNPIGGCVVACSLPEGASEEPAFMELYHSIFRQSDKVVAARLQKALDEKELAVGTDIQRLGGMVVNEVFGISLRARAGASKEELTTQARFGVAQIIRSNRP